MSVEGLRGSNLGLSSFWASLGEPQELDSDQKESSSLRSLQSSVQTVHEMIDKRGGFAYLTGFVLVPSQFLGPKAAAAKERIAQAAHGKAFILEHFSLPIQGSETTVEGVIYFPPNWDRSDQSRCVLYHNPNGITLSEYFREGELSWTPNEIVKIAHCPLILYDYRGTGLSSENTCMSSLAFKPTYDSVLRDGQTVLEEALKRFKTVNIMGSSLGGGVATITLAHHLKEHPADAKRVSLTNHDSFSTTPKVVFPHWPRVANGLGWALGALLNAESSMQELIQRRIPITVLCHKQDPVIPKGARMAEWIETVARPKNVAVIYSPHYGHADLSADMIRELGHVFEQFGRI